MIINVVFDSSVTNPAAPAPVAFRQDVSDVAAMIASQFTDPITFTVHVGYGEINGTRMPSGALGTSLGPTEAAYSYADILSHLQVDHPTADDAAAAASLPSTDPTPGTHVYKLDTVEAAALGLIAPPAAIDTYIGLSKSNAFDYDRSDGIGVNQYDFVAVVFHEITEVMGRYLDTGFGTPPTYSLLDLFHYAASGSRDFSAAQPGYFSINGGITDLADFNSNANGDPADWADATNVPGLSHYAGNDSLRAFSNSGVENSISEVDLTEMDVLGYDRVPDDIRGNASTNQTLAVNGTANGTIEACFDQDWFRCTLTAGDTYFIREQGLDHAAGTLSDPFLRLYDGSGTRIAFNDDAEGRDSRIVFTPTASGTYYIAAGAHKDGFDNGTSYLGTYTVKLVEDDYGDDAQSAAPTAINTTIKGTINYVGDRDWFAVQLLAGFDYTFTEEGAVLADTSHGTLADPYLRVYDASSSLIAQNDNASGDPGSDNKDAAIHYTPTVSGTYFIAAAANGDAATGTYTLVTSVVDSPPDGLTLSNGEIAENTPAGTVIGTLTAHDPDTGDILSLSLTSNPGGHFAIAGNQLTVAQPLDFETAATDQVTVRVTDAFGATFDKSFTVTVDNVSPEIIKGTAGNDRLVGGSDRDFITGGHGTDRMTGHGAADRFIFNTIGDSRPGAAHDVISDFDQSSGRFVQAEGDRIDLTGIEAAYHAHFWFTAQAITQPGPRYHVGFDSSHGLLQLDIDGNGKADFEVALANVHEFVRADLLM